MSDLRSKAASFIADRNGTPRPRRDDHDETRYSDQQVEFHHEFTLGASGEVYPPGRYVIETAEDSYAAAGRTAHVRKSTLLIVQTASGTRSVPINVGELEAALIEDSQREKLDPEAGSTAPETPKIPQPNRCSLKWSATGLNGCQPTYSSGEDIAKQCKRCHRCRKAGRKAMSRALLVDLDEGQVVARCLAEDVGISTIERLSSGGVRLVCSSRDGAARMARRLKPHLIDGAIVRERRRRTTPLW